MIDVVSADKFTAYLDVLSIHWKSGEGDFLEFRRNSSLRRRSRLRNEIRQTAPQGSLTPPNIPMFLSFWNAHQQNVPTKTQPKLVKSHIAYGIKVSEYSHKIEVY